MVECYLLPVLLTYDTMVTVSTRWLLLRASRCGLPCCAGLCAVTEEKDVVKLKHSLHRNTLLRFQALCYPLEACAV